MRTNNEDEHEPLQQRVAGVRAESSGRRTTTMVVLAFATGLAAGVGLLHVLGRSGRASSHGEASFASPSLRVETSASSSCEPLRVPANQEAPMLATSAGIPPSAPPLAPDTCTKVLAAASARRRTRTSESASGPSSWLNGWPSWRELRDLDAKQTELSPVHASYAELSDAGDVGRGPSSCRWAVMMDAAHAMHARYFTLQQAAERRFLSDLEAGLCGKSQGGSSELAYQAALHELVAPLREAIVRHTHAAFFIKDVCTNAVDVMKAVEADAFVLSQKMTNGKGRGAERYREVLRRTYKWCGAAILDHEPFNVVEGYHVINLTNHLMRTGPAFCTQPVSARVETLRAWNRSLEAVLRHHKEDRAFEELRGVFYAVCDRNAETGEDRAFNSSTIAVIETQLWAPHDSEKCAPDITVPMIIDSIGNDTTLYVALAKNSLQHALTWGTRGGQGGIHSYALARCAAPLANDGWVSADPINNSEQACRLLATSTVADDRVACPLELIAGSDNPRLPTAAAFAYSSTVQSLALPITFAPVYHKIAPFCGDPILFPSPSTAEATTSLLFPRPETPFVMESYTEEQRAHWAQCGPSTSRTHKSYSEKSASSEKERDQLVVSRPPTVVLDPSRHPPRPRHATDGHQNRIFDLVTHTNLQRCNGSACVRAAEALDAYHDMMLDVSVLRNWWLYNSIERKLPREELNQKVCALPRKMASLALTVLSKLDGVLSGLREAAPQLSVTCVAPRRMPSLRELGLKGSVPGIPNTR